MHTVLIIHDNPIRQFPRRRTPGEGDGEREREREREKKKNPIHSLRSAPLSCLLVTRLP